MLKATYSVKGTFSLKNENDGHLMARSLTHISRSTIRGALMASAFKYKGKRWAEDHFYQIKEALVFPQEPHSFSKQQEKRSKLSTTAIEYGLSVTPSKKAKTQPSNPSGVESLTTVGIREYVYTDTVSFYIDETIEDVVELLANITRLGDSESIVALKCIEHTNELIDVLCPTQAFDYTQSYTHDPDWSPKMQLAQINAYSPKYKRKTVSLRCETRTLVLPDTLPSE